MMPKNCHRCMLLCQVTAGIKLDSPVTVPSPYRSLEGLLCIYTHRRVKSWLVVCSAICKQLFSVVQEGQFFHDALLINLSWILETTVRCVSKMAYRYTTTHYLGFCLPQREATGLQRRCMWCF